VAGEVRSKVNRDVPLTVIASGSYLWLMSLKHSAVRRFKSERAGRTEIMRRLGIGRASVRRILEAG
jgi:hypothetical protein